MTETPEVEDIATETPAPAPVSVPVEWVRHGSGDWVLYIGGQRVHDAAVIAEHLKDRPTSE